MNYTEEQYWQEIQRLKEENLALRLELAIYGGEVSGIRGASAGGTYSSSMDLPRIEEEKK